MFKKLRSPSGSLPGTVTAHEKALAPKIHVIDYSVTDFAEYDMNPADVNQLTELKDRNSVSWIDVQGLGDATLIENIGQIFNLHPLALEDVVNIPQRPKAEDYEKIVFMVTFMLTTKNIPHIEAEQIGIFLGPNFIVSFQEKYGDVFEKVRKRLRLNNSPARKHGADYLAYALLDAIIDAYYPILEQIGEYLEELEIAVIDTPERSTIGAVYQIRRELLKLRRTIFPQRELISTLLRDQNNLFKKDTQIYLRDCYDHCAQAIDVLETYRDMAGQLMEAYLSGVNNKMNEIMKLLTVISTIFIPLSFLSSVYGMNFEYMPELKFYWGYPVFWFVMLALGFGMLRYFRQKKWV